MQAYGHKTCGLACLQETRATWAFLLSSRNGKEGRVRKEGAVYPGWPMGIAFHLGEDQVSGFEIAAHGDVAVAAGGARRAAPAAETNRGRCARSSVVLTTTR